MSRRFRAEQFTDSGWSSGTREKKARFTNALIRFIDNDCPEEAFTTALYDGLSTHGYFGFIAHYDRHGFYTAQLSTPERRARFLDSLLRACERDAHTDRPDLWSDVKHALLQHHANENTPASS
ncbi:hypothetical protein ACFOYW_16625 [Gryllotalpicola reticulitermitis]|uniref:Uncharacterized protein n=1 Tax=Gryllotalpicola reticulitermitis TaxID=1184153 RepID=A0ABV8Q9K8_9MICO